jgi:hypothetical protein
MTDADLDGFENQAAMDVDIGSVPVADRAERIIALIAEVRRLRAERDELRTSLAATSKERDVFAKVAKLRGEQIDYLAKRLSETKIQRDELLAEAEARAKEDP